MSAQLNKLGQVTVQIPQIGDINSVDGQTIEKLKSEIQEIDARIETWRSICLKENIDIFPEVQELSQCKVESSEILGDYRVYLVRLVEAEERICQNIVRKVKSNLRREPTKLALETAHSRLVKLTAKTVPWFSFASKEGVDISQELEVLRAAYKSSFEQLGEDIANRDNVKEVIQKRLYTLRLECSVRVIHKLFKYMVLKEAEIEKGRDWFDCKRVEIIEGIANDALMELPKSGSLAALEQKSIEVLTCFRNNLELVRANISQYEKMADREWLKREVQERGYRLARYAIDQRDEALAREILVAQQLAMALFDTAISTDEIRERVNCAFEAYAKRATGLRSSMPCGSHDDLNNAKWQEGA